MKKPRLNKTEFERRANLVHNNLYDYTKFDYKRIDIKSIIICPVHGEFLQDAHSHLAGSGCKRCFNNKRTRTLEEFISKANRIHKNKYDYSKSVYINKRTKIQVICPMHGSFWVNAGDHVTERGNATGCKKCAIAARTDTLLSFIEKTKKIHGDIYDYSKVEYINSQTKIIIICKIHGEFLQKPNKHLLGHGCSQCNCPETITTESFIIRANKIHKNKYDYIDVNYINNRIKIKIKCKKHGEFLQTPDSHLQGIGCPNCKRSKGEEIISNYLLNRDIIFTSQKTFKECRNKKVLPFDFYLPEYNIIIEFDGEQHFKLTKYKDAEKIFKRTKKHDQIKTKYCEKNNIKLVRIHYKDFDNICEILDRSIK